MVIQELWFQFLCINPSSEQPWFLFHLIKWQNSNWLNRTGAVLRNRQVSPVPTEHDKPQWWGGPGRSWGTLLGFARWRKDTGDCSRAWTRGQAPSWAVQTGRLRATHAPNNKVLVIRTSIVLPTTSFTTSPLSWATHTTTLLTQYQIISLFSLLTFYPVTVHSTYLCLLQKNRQGYDFVPFKYLPKSL